MPKNPNKPDNQERQAPNRGKQSDESSREASSGKGTSNQPSRKDTSGSESGRKEPGREEKGGERSASSSRNAGADRGIDRSRTEPGLTEETTRQGRGQEAEGLDVDELDEQNQEL